MILLIESSSKNCSVALAKDNKILCLRELSDEDYVHAEKLHEFIEELFSTTSTSYKDLLAVAVSKGPGSYTGLRIGISAAKGICMACDIPLIAIPTTEILARHAKSTFPNYAYYTPMIDARRDEVYTALYNNDLDVLVEVCNELVNVEFTARFGGNSSLYIGDGANKCIEFTYKKNIIFIQPSASMMVTAATVRYISNEFEDLAYFEPFYLKDFIPGKAKSPGL